MDDATDDLVGGSTRGGDPRGMARSVGEDADRGSLWRRWTDGGTDVHFHRVCEVVPRVTLERSWPYVRAIPTEGDRPTFVPLRDEEGGGEERPAEEVQLTFIGGLPRQLLRHVPLVVLVATLVLFVGAEFTPHVGGVSELIPGFSGTNALLFGLFLSLTPLLLWLLSTADVVDQREFPRAVVVYSLAALLGCGVLASIALMMTADNPRTVSPNVVFVSGYLLVLLVGGQLLYEATLRIENLFVTLGELDSDIVSDRREYRRFLTRLHDGLEARSLFGLRPSRVFGVLFAAQFAIIWVIGSGPQNLDYAPGLVVNFVFNVVLATVAFQFFVLVHHFHKLLADADEDGTRALTYEPFHVDGHGGFRDFGRFATRINIILSLAGLYLVYRLYVVGGRGLPPGGLLSFEDPIVLTVWMVSFVAPVLAYAVGAGAWGYYTFWSLHTKMVRDKREIAWQYQGSSHRTDVDRSPSVGDRLDSFDEASGPEWDALQSAPTWPIDVNKMLSLLSGNALPLLLPASKFLF